MARESKLRIVSVYPTMLGTYGDGGNLRVFAVRARARGHAVDAIELDAGEPVPAIADLYVLGGGEDDAQVAAVGALRRDGGLARGIEAGAVVFAVCAGYQLLGKEFPGSDGVATPGLDVLDVTTTRLPTRAVGELLALPDAASGLVEPLTGYENHAGGTRLGPTARPLGAVRTGVGNGVRNSDTAPSEGAIQGRIVGTYLHGPGLARNPELADLLLSWALGEELAAWDQPDIAALRAERLHAAGER